MRKQTIDILTSCPDPKAVCVMGNVAVARATIESGIRGVFAYPGTPSTEISEVFNYVSSFQLSKENQKKYPEQTTGRIYFEYSVNEKIALEKAIAFSIGNRPAMCIMKNVGLNVASDALMTITYQTINAPLLIVVCDDPGCHSSSNEQDSRYWGPMATVPVFNPSTPASAFVMAKEALALSGKLKIPVILRMTTRVSHTRGMISYGTITGDNPSGKFDFIPDHINIPARTAGAHRKLISKLADPAVDEIHKKYFSVSQSHSSPASAIIASGITAAYCREIITVNDFWNHVTLVEIGVTHPFPDKEMAELIQNGLQKILVIEELDPVVENNVRIIAQKIGSGVEIFGKGFSTLSPAGEYSLDMVRKALEDFMEKSLLKNEKIIAPEGAVPVSVPQRPPVLCAGCPHRATFYLLKLVIPRDQKELILCGDIGCFGLGALPPLNMIDTIHHMGMSISMAQGISEALKSDRDLTDSNQGGPGKMEHRKTVALVGDGTFFHSGVASLMNAVYSRSDILVVIFDNRTIGMTGHQDHPGAAHPPRYRELDIASVVRGIGVETVEAINPFNLRDSYIRMQKAMNAEGVSVVIARAPCIFLTELNLKKYAKRRITIDHQRCNICANHCDLSMNCSRIGSSHGNLVRAKAKIAAPVQIEGESQLCPANICNHGFFTAIQEGDYKSAVEIVRDKMLFARTCGDICHRPCESRGNKNNDKSIPIRALKKFVSAVNENFRDFSAPKQRILNIKPNGKHVAVIGAGPAGLSAGYDLLQAGYRVTLYEKESKPGGMVTFAIPSFRMDKDGFLYEAQQLESMGADFRWKKQLGRDFSLEEISQQYDAVLIAIGLRHSKKLDIPGNIPSEKYFDALSFLRKYNEGLMNIKPGSAVLVIGGGNSAMDAARSVKRQSPMNIVMVSCIETSAAMPAFPEEVYNAQKDGVVILNDSYVNRSTVDRAGKILVELYSWSGRKLLTPIECDYIITAIGQESAVEDLNGYGRDLLDGSKRVKNNEIAYTGVQNIFAAGDIAAGNHMSVIGAIASGKKAATGIRQFLEKYPYDYEGSIALEALNSGKVVPYSGRNHKKADVTGIVIEYNLYQPCMKCNHCIENFGCPAMMRVNGKVEVDMSKCTLCGFCIEVCPNDAIRWEME